MPQDALNVAVPLCIDLDGTFVCSDTLYESLLAKLRKAPWIVLLLPFWLLRGRAFVKAKLADGDLSVASLPHLADFHTFVQAQHAAGRTLVLATGADQLVAQRVQAAYPYFDQVLASDGQTNLTGKHKLAALQSRFEQFDYAGNSSADLPLWRAARKCYLVAPTTSVTRALKGESLAFEREFRPAAKSKVLQMLKALRPHQWAKNALLFVPLVTAHAIGDALAWLEVALAFVAFSALASSVYLVNDLLDLEHDRQHPTKRKRPFAAGTLALKHAFWMVPALWLATLVVTLQLPLSFQLTLAVYFVLTTLYSFFLKQQTLLDVILLASLYTIRVQAGAEAIQVDVSPWLRAFCLFFFVSLAFTKRYSELHRLEQGTGTDTGMRGTGTDIDAAQSKPQQIAGRGYQLDDVPMLAQMGLACGYLSVLVMALYVNSPEVHVLYRHPQWLWAICLVVLYWISRVWLLTQRGQMHEDPVVFAIRDYTSYGLGLVCAAILWLAV